MAIKFLSGLNLSNVSAGSLLKLDSNGNIVAAVAGTDYSTTSGIWSTAGSNPTTAYYSGNVRVGTYQSSIEAGAKLHVFDYQTTTPKLLIEDGNTGDASMQFKISTQQYTMGIDNSDSDVFKFSASSAFDTYNAFTVNGTGNVTFASDVYNAGLIKTRNNNYGVLSAYGSEGFSYEPVESSSATVRYWLRFDYTNNGSYPYLTNRTPNGAVVIKTGTAAGGGENEHFRIKGGDGTVDAYFTNVNLGIGTNSPEGRLDIRGTYGRWRVNGYGGMYFRNDSDTGYTRYIHPRSDGSLSFGRIADTNLSGTNPDKYAASSYDQFYLDATGDVGIGTTSLSDKLTVNGNISLENSGTPIFTIRDTGNAGGGGAAGIIRFKNTGGDAIGIGYTGNDTTTSDLLISTNAASTYGGYLGLEADAVSDPSSIILDPKTNVLVTNGDLGIGTTNPSNKLHVVGDIYTSANLKTSSIISTNAGLTIDNTGIQPDQGEVENVFTAKWSGTTVAGIDNEGYVTATGFKKSGTTGFLKSDGSVDTATYISNIPSEYVTDTELATTLSTYIENTDVSFVLNGNDILIGDEIALGGGLSYDSNTGTLSSSDNNTTYTAGTGLTLTGTEFSVTSGTYAAASHNHDSRYYTETEVDTLLLGKASTSTATTSKDGLMSSTDKTKLDGIAAGAEVNVQADWNQATTTSDDYIKNKPTLGTAASSAATDFVSVSGDTMTGTLALDNQDSLSFESGKHWITYNDGEGNFNIRVGHKSDSTPNEVSTESGYAFHDEWSQSSGWREFNISSTSITAGNDVGTWRRQMYYDYNDVQLAYQGGVKFQTTNTGITITGEIITTGGNSTNWNTAYGWGNHAGLYAAASHNHDSRYYTETEIDTLLAGYASTDTATSSKNGLMSSTDKSKLDGIASGAEVNVQSDWNATSGDAFIQNKPSLGTAAAAASTDFVAVAGDTITGQIIFPTAIGNRPVFGEGIIARSDSGDTTGTHDIWGISERYYPSAAETGDQWGIQWSGTPNEINFIGDGSKKFSIDLDTAGKVKIDGNDVATESYVDQAISNLVNSAPAALNTLDELAAALGDDSSFSTTVSTALGNRLRIDTNAQNLTATEKSNAITNLGLGTAATSSTGDFAAASHTHSQYLRSDASDVYDGRTLSFGTTGNGSNANGAFLTIEGNTDSSGEGSGRIFFREHNSTELSMDNYGMSIGYRGGGTSVNTPGGNNWTGLASISNGQWGMWGHDNNLTGSLIMYGDRAATFVDFAGNNVQGITDLYVDDQIISTGDTNTYIQFHAADQWRVVTGGAERLEVNNTAVTVAGDLSVGNDVTITGDLRAASKSFDIPHPTKEGKRLVYGSLEGAEHGVYVRGRQSENVIELPDHWTGLVHEDTITVQITPIGRACAWVEKVEDNKVYVGIDHGHEFFYFVQAERKDINKLVVEQDA